MSKLVAYVWTKGDPSVGINGERAEVIFDDDLSDKEFREHARDELGMCFSAIWHEKATVMFSDETTGNDLEDLG